MKDSRAMATLGVAGVALAAPVCFLALTRIFGEETEGIPLMMLGVGLLGLLVLLGRKLRGSTYRAVWVLVGAAAALAALVLGFGIVSFMGARM